MPTKSTSKSISRILLQFQSCSRKSRRLSESRALSSTMVGIPVPKIPKNDIDVLANQPKAGASTENDPNDTFSLPLDQFTRDLNINTTSPYVAAKEAVQGFAQLPADASKTFIYTGNITNDSVTFPTLMTLGAGKSATAHIIHNAATVYADRGFK